MNPLEVSCGVVEAELRHPPPFPRTLPAQEAAASAILRIILSMICPLLGGRLVFGILQFVNSIFSEVKNDKRGEKQGENRKLYIVYNKMKY